MHILVVSIGPVQEFIESARKCRDLWFGSWLLSELARAAARGITDFEGRPEADVLVFPGAKTSDKHCAVANKIVARIHNDPTLVAAAGERAMQARLREIRDGAFARVAPRHPRRAELFRIATAEVQVEAMMEYFWASAPQSGSYSEAWHEAERLLAAVKNTKRWQQPSWAQDGVPKSSLDGLRESVLDEALFDRPRTRIEAQIMRADRRRREFGVHGSERLCGVGLLKRFGNRDADPHQSTANDRPDRIFSTPHVASGPFRAGLARLPHGAEAWSSFCHKLDAIDPGILRELDVLLPSSSDKTTGTVDGSVFYEGRLLETLEELEVAPEHHGRAKKAVREFLKDVRELGEPIPYYALLLADGDHMGAVIDSLTSFRDHRHLSETLEQFASSTRAVVRSHGGALVYAGGDDVLALLPLHTVLACATELAQRFAETMRAWKVHEGNTDRSPTLSMGIAIVHHLVPLDASLALVRATERRAKAVKGKNAVAITVKKRGGEPIEVADHWGALDRRLQALVKLHRADAISANAQYELMDLADRLEGAGPKKDVLKKVRQAEVERILARKQSNKGLERMARETIEFLKQCGSVTDRNESLTDPVRLGKELYVAGLMARAEDQAQVEMDSRRQDVQEAAR